ncbi:MAG TPA: branched-chain amino acid ABC transporter permease [Burkholderiaceae bacterium]|nr:branched-chain amino acid ABC transporter permease [Burkholderiaceae bacterium]
MSGVALRRCLPAASCAVAWALACRWGWVPSSAFAQFLVLSLGATSLRLLAGTTGLFSFSHAIHAATGAYAVAWTMRVLSEGNANAYGASVALAVMPLIAAIVAMVVAWPVGHLLKTRSGTAYAMLTFAIGECIHLVALAAPTVFGGEAGVSMDRTLGTGADFAWIVQCAWWLLAMIALAFIDKSAFAQGLRAVRDDALRAQTMGIDAPALRRRVNVLAAGVAGLAGALSVIEFEIVTPEAYAISHSSIWLIAMLLGGMHRFVGPVVGASLVLLCSTVVAQWTSAWPLVLGAVFVAGVLFRPQGVIAPSRA